MLGLLSFLPTTAFVPQYLFLLAGIWAFVRNPKSVANVIQQATSKQVVVSPVFVITFIILLASGLNFVLNAPDPIHTPVFFPQFVLMPITLFIASQLTRRDIDVLILLVGFEVLVAIAESIMGVSTFFSGLANYEVFEDSELLYFNRPLGLSVNSSILAVKCLLLILLIDFFNAYKGWFNKLIWLLLLVGIFITFPRSVFLALMVFFGFKFWFWLKADKPVVDWFYSLIGVAVVLFGLSFLIVENLEVIIKQLTRNTQKVDLTGRDKIWMFFTDFIADNPWFGNASHKLWFGNYHAHNSFLQVLSTNGVLIGSLYIVLILVYWVKRNFIYVATIITYGLFQYAFFWGISITDILFFYFLLNYEKRVYPSYTLNSSNNLNNK